MNEPLILDDLVDKIYDVIKREKKRDKYFGRLGASGIGKECLRAVFYSWRGFTEGEFPGRILRLFETGFQQEDRIVADLQKAGLKVWAEKEDGTQYKFIHESGHFVAKVDGIVKNVFEDSDLVFLLEIKTMSDKAFKRLLKSGIQQDHNYQIHSGMYLVGLDWGLYVVLNKNDEQYYIEVIERDPKIIASLQTRLNGLILKHSTAPPRISDDATDFKCKWCNHRSVCLGVTAPVVSCRSCSNVSPIENGEWLCGLHGVVLNMKQQLSGCPDYMEFGK